MQSLTQPRMFGAAGLLLLAAGLLWGAFKHEKPERLPPGWQPVNDRLAVLEENEAVGAHPGGVADAASGTSASGGTSPAAGTDRSDQLSDADAAPDQPDAAGGEAAPSGGEAAPSGGETAPPGSPGFDINRATAAEWDELPGIGPSKAQAIVEDRERNGPFRSIDDLARVRGIGPKLLERLREAIKERQNAGGG